MSTAAVLTKQERRVLERAAAGDTNVQIGKLLYLSAETVKSHLKRVFVKLEARNRAHAVAEGYRLGILRPAANPPVAFVAMAPVSRAIARQEWKAALEMLLEAGVAKAAAVEFLAGERQLAIESGWEPARDRARP